MPFSREEGFFFPKYYPAHFYFETCNTGLRTQQIVVFHRRVAIALLCRALLCHGLDDIGGIDGAAVHERGNLISLQITRRHRSANCGPRPSS